MLLRSTSAKMTTDNLFSELAGGWPFMLKIGNSLTSAMKESKESPKVSSQQEAV